MKLIAITESTNSYWVLTSGRFVAQWVRAQYPIELSVVELVPLEDVAAESAFILHADLAQDSAGGQVVSEMGRKNAV